MTANPEVPCWTCGQPMPASEAMWAPEPSADGGIEDVQAASCAACVTIHECWLRAGEEPR